MFPTVLQGDLHLGTGRHIRLGVRIIIEDLQHGQFVDGKIDFRIPGGRDARERPAGRPHHVADAVLLEADIAVERREDLRVLEIDLLFGQRRFGVFQLGLSGEIVHFRRFVVALRGGFLAQKLFLPFVFDVGVPQLDLGFVDFGLGLVDRRFVHGRIDLEELGPLFDQLTFHEIGFGQKTGNVRGKTDRVERLHFADLGHGIGEIHFKGGFDDDRRQLGRLLLFFFFAPRGQRQPAGCQQCRRGKDKSIRKHDQSSFYVWIFAN